MVSTLVALSLLLLFLILVNKFLPIISAANPTKLKLQAINTANECMIQTLETNDFRMFSRSVDHNIALRQEVRTLFNRIHIKIIIKKSLMSLLLMVYFNRPFLSFLINLSFIASLNVIIEIYIMPIFSW